jgi:hypothetical protein
MLSIETTAIVTAICVLLAFVGLVIGRYEDRRAIRTREQRADEGGENDVTVTVEVDGQRQVYRHLSPETYRRLVATLGEGRLETTATTSRPPART